MKIELEIEIEIEIELKMPPKKKRKEDICYVCQDFVANVGHKTSKCPKIVCKMCSKSGHISKLCPFTMLSDTKPPMIKLEKDSKEFIFKQVCKSELMEKSEFKKSRKNSKAVEIIVQPKDEFCAEEQKAIDMFIYPLLHREELIQCITSEDSK
jgi:hypothetical protein